jgi:hypothetical protein
MPCDSSTVAVGNRFENLAVVIDLVRANEQLRHVDLHGMGFRIDQARELGVIARDRPLLAAIRYFTLCLRNSFAHDYMQCAY